MAEIDLVIEGMHCGACVRRVSQALASAEGVSVGEVRVGAARVSLSDPAGGADLAIAALAKAGFKAQIAE
jgi:copper chaperone CopZ